ncbi:MAG: ArnT family glycosyltransferase [Syntrophales bacterium]
MKTPARTFAESRWSIPAIAVLYLLLAVLLIAVIGFRTKPDIEILLTRWFARFLWADFLLILIGVALCRSDIAAAFRELFAGPPHRLTTPHPGPLPANIPPPLAGGGKGEGARENGMNHPLLSPPLAGWEGGGGKGERSSRRSLLHRPGVYLLAILIVGLLLVTLAAPQVHRIYYDEDIYANMGQNIAFTGQTGMANYGTFEYGEYFVNWLLYNKDPSGWPFLIGLVFQLFGTDETYAFILNNLLYAGGILIVFFIVRTMAGGWFAGLSAALIYALIPHNLVWAGTISAENPAAVVGGLAVLCTLVWLRSRAPRHLFLAVAVLPFAGAMRPESSLIWLWAAAAAAMNLFSAAPLRIPTPHPDPLPQGEREIEGRHPHEERGRERGLPYGERDIGWDLHSPPLAGGDEGEGETDAGGALRPNPFTTRVFWALGLVSFAFAIPLVWHFHAMSGQSWGAEGAKFATAFFLKNLATNGLYYLNNAEFPVLFTLLALIGLAAGKGTAVRMDEKPGWLPRLMILLWFLQFWGIFLFFYAGSYKYGADVRFALVSFMPIAVLGGIGAEVLRRWGAAALRTAGRQEQEAGGQDGSSTARNCRRSEDPAVGRIGGEEAGAGVGSPPAGSTQSETERASAPGRLSVAAVLVLVLIFSWLKFLPLVRLVGQEAWGARYDHVHAREFIKKIPNRSIVLTHIPTMFLLWGQNAIQTYAGVNNPDIIQDLMKRYGGHVYFHQSYWCNTLNDANRQVCDGIRQRYNLEPVATAREQTNEYGLYLMAFKK